MIRKDCLFCQIAHHKEPAEIIFENEKYIVIENKFPKVKVHVLVMPKDHIVLEKTTEKDKDTMSDLVLICKEAARKKGIAESGYRIIMNSGEDSMRHFEHLHIHIMGGEKLGDIV